MSDYIDREAAEILMCDACEYRCKHHVRASGQSLITADDCYHLRNLYDIPAADVAEVVRCEDCRHSYLEPYAAGIAHRICAYGMGADCEVKDDFYCAFGVKTDEPFVKDTNVLNRNESEDEDNG